MGAGVEQEVGVADDLVVGQRLSVAFRRHHQAEQVVGRVAPLLLDQPGQVLVDVGRGVLGGFRRHGLPRFAFLEDLEVVGDPLLVGLGDADHVAGDDDRQLPGELGPEVDLLRVPLERGVEQAFHLRLDHRGEFFADRLGGEPALEEPAPPGLIGRVALEDVRPAEQRGVVDVDALGAGVGLPVARDGPDVVVAGDRVDTRTPRCSRGAARRAASGTPRRGPRWYPP